MLCYASHTRSQDVVPQTAAFVIHGVRGNAKEYHDRALAVFRKALPDVNVLVLTPRLGRGFAYGGFFDAVPRIWANVSAQTGLRTFDIYGHSAGAQYLQRLLTRRPGILPSVNHAAVMNAGWYADDFLSRSPRCTVYVGERDTDPNHRYLNRGAAQMRQGGSRYARFAFARANCAGAHTRFRVVPECGHDFACMLEHVLASGDRKRTAPVRGLRKN